MDVTDYLHNVYRSIRLRLQRNDIIVYFRVSSGLYISSADQSMGTASIAFIKHIFYNNLRSPNFLSQRLLMSVKMIITLSSAAGMERRRRML